MVGGASEEGDEEKGEEEEERGEEGEVCPIIVNRVGGHTTSSEVSGYYGRQHTDIAVGCILCEREREREREE